MKQSIPTDVNYDDDDNGNDDDDGDDGDKVKWCSLKR